MNRHKKPGPGRCFHLQESGRLYLSYSLIKTRLVLTKDQWIYRLVTPTDVTMPHGLTVSTLKTLTDRWFQTTGQLNVGSKTSGIFFHYLAERMCIFV